MKTPRYYLSHNEYVSFFRECLYNNIHNGSDCDMSHCINGIRYIPVLLSEDVKNGDCLMFVRRARLRCSDVIIYNTNIGIIDDHNSLSYPVILGSIGRAFSSVLLYTCQPPSQVKPFYFYDHIPFGALVYRVAASMNKCGNKYHARPLPLP